MAKLLKISQMLAGRSVAAPATEDRFLLHEDGKQNAGFIKYGDLVNSISGDLPSPPAAPSLSDIKLFSSFEGADVTYINSTFASYSSVYFYVPTAGVLMVDISVLGQTTSNGSTGTHYLDYRWSVNGNPQSIDNLSLNFNPNNAYTTNFAHAGTYSLTFAHYVNVGGFTGDLAFRRTTTAWGTAKVYSARITGLYIPGAVTANW